jgi:DNA-binding transcriptional ArsR family regulator
MPEPKLSWDLGTAYDLFISLQVLHEPADFGVRGAWAAGVRARLPAPEREILEQSLHLFYVPVHWIHTLPDPKDVLTVLWTLGQVPPAERLPLLALDPEVPPAVAGPLQAIAGRGSWNEADRDALQAAYQREVGKRYSAETLATMLDWWARPKEFGERYLAALQGYQEAFFAEEETRIRPALERALARALDLARNLDLPDLLEELSQGLRFSEMPELVELVLAPSYWITPLMLFGKASATQAVWVFGARPPDVSLVPGEAVPDAMLRALKALSDPTRLRILHYLCDEPLSPSDLARRLRLRLPTVTHHLKTLRLAGLVQLILTEEKEEKRYACRPGTVIATFSALQRFLGISPE